MQEVILKWFFYKALDRRMNLDGEIFFYFKIKDIF